MERWAEIVVFWFAAFVAGAATGLLGVRSWASSVDVSASTFSYFGLAVFLIGAIAAVFMYAWERLVPAEEAAQTILDTRQALWTDADAE